jgi:hypothetical protein
VFFVVEKQPSTRHVPPPIHHVLTIKKPSPATHFFQNTPQKHSKTLKSQTPTTAIFFCSKNDSPAKASPSFQRHVLPDGLPAREAVTS